VKPFDLDVAQMFGHSPKTIMRDETVVRRYEDATYSVEHLDDFSTTCYSRGRWPAKTGSPTRSTAR
jgi:hypothetical protein